MINLFLKTWIQIYAVLLLFIAFYLESICVSSTKVPTYTFISDWQSKRPWNKRWGGSLFPELFTWYPGYRSSNVSHYYSCFKLDTRFKKKWKARLCFIWYLYTVGFHTLDVGSCLCSPRPEWSQLWNERGGRWFQNSAPPGRSAGRCSTKTKLLNGSPLPAEHKSRWLLQLITGSYQNALKVLF